MKPSPRTAAAALLAGITLSVAAAGCGLLEGRSEPRPLPPPPRPAEPQPQPVADEPAAPEPDWLAEYKRTVERIQANEPVALPAEEPVAPPPQEETAREPVVAPPPVRVEPPPQMVEPVAPPPAFDDTAAFEQAEPAAPPPLETRELGQDELSTLLAAGRQHAALLDDRTTALVNRFLDEGLAAMQGGDLGQAAEYFGSAVELDPSNAAARELYDQARLLGGEEVSGLGTLARSAHDRAAARAEQQEILVQHQVEQGRAALAAENPELAQRHFEDALALLRAGPLAGPRSALEQQIAGLLMSARAQALDLAQRREAELTRRAVELQEQHERAEQLADERRVDQLLRTADEAFVRGDYPAAEAALDEALELEPHDADVGELLAIANKARHEATARETRRLYQREWQDTFDDLEQMGVPQNDVIAFPDESDWAAVVERGNKSFAAAADGRAPLDQAVADRLAEVRIPVDFQDIMLDEIVANLHQVTGVNFLLSPEVQDAALEDPYNMLDRAPKPVDRVLKVLLEDLSVTPLTYEIRDGVVHIITQEESRGDYVLEMYDIRDLTVVPSDYGAEDFNLLPSGIDVESFRGGVADEDPLPFIAEDAVLSLIQENIAVDSWVDDPERTIQLLPGTLVVRQTPDVHAQIVDLLADLRANTKTLVHIETRFIEVEDSFLEDIGVDFRGLDDQQLEDFGTSGVGFGTADDPLGIGTGADAGAFYETSDAVLKGRTENLFDFTLGEGATLNNAGGLSLQALFLDDDDVQAVLRAVTKYQNTNIVNAPALTLRSGQRGNIEVLVHRTYVRDFEPEIAQAAVIAQPELDNVKEGVVLDVRAVASADRRFITLELRPTVAELIPDANGDVLPDMTVSLATGNASNVVIEFPELRIQRVRTTATVPDGATLMLGGLKKSVEQEQKSGVPFLSEIPVVSFFFSRQGEYTSRRKLIILLKASLIVPEENEPILGFAK